MITADTITNDQIRQLTALLGPNLADLVSRALSDLARYCKTCGVDIGTRCTNMSVTGYRPLKKSHPYRLEKQREARARCAEILSRRCAKCGALNDHAEWDGENCPWCPR